MDISKVLWAGNRNEAVVGNKYIVADTLDDLRKRVETGTCVYLLDHIDADDDIYPFNMINEDGQLVRYLYAHPVESKWRPFKDVDELLNTWYRLTSQENWPYLHGMSIPTIWVHQKDSDNRRLITTFEKDTVCVDSVWTGLNQLFEHFEFLDGTPCGVEE